MTVKDLIKELLHFLGEYPILTSIPLLALSVYLIFDVLPKTYRRDSYESLYSYYNKLGVTLVLIFFSLLFLIIQLSKVS